jgi:23S rRNA (guanosine2251-2'-O)-methyltransferase
LAGIHPVREALRAHRALDRVLVARGAAGPRLQEIIDLCRDLNIPVRFEPRDQLDRASEGAAHQGVVGIGAAHKYTTLDAVAGRARMLVILDGVEDPHNLGAVVRTANAAGADAVVVPERRAAGLTETVAKAAAGALEYVPVARVGNLNRALEDLKRRGFWIYGLDERASRTHENTEFTEPAAIVLGSEGEGLHHQVREHCDVLIRIPMSGKIASLNVSVAAGVVLFDWKRRRAHKETR